MIVAKEVGIELAQLDGAGHTVFAMPLRRGLVSHQMLRNSKHPVRHDKAGHVFSRPSDRDPLFCNSQCAAEVANSREENVQTGKKLQLMVLSSKVSASVIPRSIAARTSSPFPLVNIDDSARASWRIISRLVPRPASSRPASACSHQFLHSSSSDNPTNNGAAQVASSTPTAMSPWSENAHSSAARTFPICGAYPERSCAPKVDWIASSCPRQLK